MRSILTSLIGAIAIVTACGKEPTEFSETDLAAFKAERRTTLLVSVDTKMLGTDLTVEVSSDILDYMINNQHELSGIWEGAEFGSPREGQWRFLVVADCDDGKDALDKLFRKSVSETVQKQLSSSVAIMCADESAYGEIRTINVD